MKGLVGKIADLIKKKETKSGEDFDIILPPAKIKLIDLKPIDYDKKLEKELNDKLVSFFISLIYKPLNNALKKHIAFINIIENSNINLAKAIKEGKITFEGSGLKSNFDGGKFPAKISKELEEMGAVYNVSQKVFNIALSSLPIDLQNAIADAALNNISLQKEINNTLDEVGELANFEKFFLEANFVSSYRKLMNSILKQLETNASPKTNEDILIPFKVNIEQERIIAENYTNNLKLNVKNFTDKQIVELRQIATENTKSGYRPEVLAKKIQERFDVAKSKAMFLASQETSLLTAQYTALKYTEGGIVKRFKWGRSFSRIPDEYHQTLYDNIYDFKNLPIIDEKTQAKGLPGERYNCKCRIIPVIEELI
jgi:SPP1 gp7 family putative phage head morphogenesis protein